MRSVLILLVFLVAAAVAAFFYLQVQGTREAEGAAPSGVAVEKAAPKSGDAMLDRPTDAAPSSERAALRAEAPKPSAAPKTDAPSTGGRSIVGRVVDATGAPIGGAQVLAQNGQGFGGAPLDAEGGFIDRNRKPLATTTAPDGKFKISGLKSGEARVAVRAKGFAPLDRANVVVAPDNDRDLGDLALEPSVILAGRVIDSLSRGVAGARILRTPDPEGGFAISFDRPMGVQVATTLADGSFEIDQLAAGGYRLVTITDDHPDQTTSGTTTRPGERQAGILITLDDGAEIQGHVVDVPAAFSGKLSVDAWPNGRASDEPTADPSSAKSGDDGMSESRKTEVAADGSFTVRGARPGYRYNLSARKAGNEIDWFGSESASVKAKAGDRNVKLVFRPESALVFDVKNKADGQPLTNFHVRAGTPWEMPMLDERGREVLEHPNGHVRFGNIRPSESSRAKLDIEAAGFKNYHQSDIQIAVGEEVDLGTILLEPAPTLTVKVTDSKGAPIENARVELRAKEDRNSRRMTLRVGGNDDQPDVQMGGPSSANTDKNGIAKLSTIEGQSCTLHVSHSEFADATSEPFQLAAGESGERTIVLTLGGSVLVHLLDAQGKPLAGSRVAHRSANDDDAGPFGGGNADAKLSDDDGQVLFERLAPGEHSFRAKIGDDDGMLHFGGGAIAMVGGGESGGDDWSRVTVAEGEKRELTIAAPIVAVVHGFVRESGQALAGATLTLSRKSKDPNAQMMMPFGPQGPSGKSDGSGEFKIDNVREGDYTLTVSHASRAMNSEFDVHVSGTDVKHDVDLPLSILEGRVVDADGKPLVNADVWPERAQKPGGRQVMMFRAVSIGGGGTSMSISNGIDNPHARTDVDGRYTLRGVAHDVDLVVKAEAKGVQPGKSDSLRVAENETKSGIDLKLESAGALDISLIGSDGNPKGQCMLTATYEGSGGGDVTPRNEFIDETGKQKLDGLKPGAWKLSVRSMGDLAGPQSSPPPPVEQVVEVKSGESKPVQLTIN